MKKRILILLLCAAALLLLIVPFRVSTASDGGTRVITALTWSVVRWHRIYAEPGVDGAEPQSGYHEATEFYFFPFNFRDNVRGKVWVEARGGFVRPAADPPDAQE